MNQSWDFKLHCNQDVLNEEGGGEGGIIYDPNCKTEPYRAGQ